MGTSTKIGHGLAKILRIKLDYRDPTGRAELTRGESMFSVESADSYLEAEPTASEWLQEITPTWQDCRRYVYNLFPFTHWLPRYNLQWLAGDLVAGITIGAVVVPQGMSYAKLAELPVQFGLYSSFMGVLIYWLFATSKDITIGPVAVMSTLTGNIIINVWDGQPNCDYSSGTPSAGCFPPQVIASALAIVAGGIVFGIGILRLGWLVDFIPLVSISAFMTGAALFIGVGQLPNLTGVAVTCNWNTRGATYTVIINMLKSFDQWRIDAALGISALIMLYLIRFCFNYLADKQPQRRRIWFFCNTMRTAFVILFYVMISAAANINLPRTSDGASESAWAILGPVPRGFQDAGVPKINKRIIGYFTSQLPAAVIVLLIEHISIAKSFGRVNNYTIDPSQELIAIGVTNLLSPFLGGFPSTGSFSRTAIKSKAGVRTPLAGVITAIVVLLAIYALPAVYFYIPSASLSAVIIHAVGDLITPPNTVYQFWKISPLEVIIFFAGVLVTVFTSIDYGIYTTVCISLALLLWRVFKAKGRFMGKVNVHSVIGDQYLQGNESKESGLNKLVGEPESSARTIFLPLDSGDGSNPTITPQHPYPGIFIYRFSEGFNYPNANHYLDHMTSEIFRQTSRTNPNSYGRPGDRPWNDPGPRKGQEEVNDPRPHLKAVILDFSSINNVDITSVQNLIDVRNQLDKYASPEKVQWHFAHINNRWTKRALASAGFGYATPEGAPEFHRWKPIFSIAEIGHDASAAAAAEQEQNRRRGPDVERGHSKQNEPEIESASNAGSDESNGFSRQITQSKAYNVGNTRIAVVHGLNRPLFHIDLASALQSAKTNIDAVNVEPGYEAAEEAKPEARPKDTDQVA